MEEEEADPVQNRDASHWQWSTYTHRGHTSSSGGSKHDNNLGGLPHRWLPTSDAALQSRRQFPSELAEARSQITATPCNIKTCSHPSDMRAAKLETAASRRSA
jgi:hypothetical protein